MSETKPSGTGGVVQMWRDSRNPTRDPQESFEGKTILIVGATAGIGYEAALKFAKLGASAILVGARNIQAAEKTKNEIKAAGTAALKVFLFHIDMAATSTIKSFVDELEKTVDHIDIAIINAGIAAPAYKLSSEGWESSIQIEVLGKALCAIFLLPILRKSSRRNGKPTILEITGSEGYLDVLDTDVPEDNTLLIEYYNDPKNWSMAKQYTVCKLLIMFFQQGLVSALKDDIHAPIVVVTSPGMTRTSLGREFPAVFRGIMWVLHSFVARTAESGSRIMVSAALLGKEANGKFWFNDEFNGRKPMVSDRVWESKWQDEYTRILDILEKAVPGTKEVLASDYQR